ncbi:MAG: mRNA cap guanine-N7 methyltransferase [Cirrosporium novae-zelandiae]|nr:MAG: mRNA cap guanine-N7 methyltransferase [Cirrosporium novae-zelandiae]
MESQRRKSSIYDPARDIFKLVPEDPPANNATNNSPNLVEPSSHKPGHDHHHPKHSVLPQADPPIWSSAAWAERNLHTHPEPAPQPKLEPEQPGPELGPFTSFSSLHQFQSSSFQVGGPEEATSSVTQGSSPLQLHHHQHLTSSTLPSTPTEVDLSRPSIPIQSPSIPAPHTPIPPEPQLPLSYCQQPPPTPLSLNCTDSPHKELQVEKLPSLRSLEQSHHTTKLPKTPSSPTSHQPPAQTKSSSLSPKLTRVSLEPSAEKPTSSTFLSNSKPTSPQHKATFESPKSPKVSPKLKSFVKTQLSNIGAFPQPRDKMTALKRSAEDESLEHNRKRARSPETSREYPVGSFSPQSTSKTSTPQSPPLKKHQAGSPTQASNDVTPSEIPKAPIPITASNLAKIPRRTNNGTKVDGGPRRQRSRSPRRNASSNYRRREPATQTRSPSPIRRSPSRSPPRQRKRPGASSRLNASDREAIRKRQAEREREQEEQSKQIAAVRGLQDVVTQHYNAVPERGREWRKTDSRIKGLRSFNNWIKSTVIQKFSPDEDFDPQNPQKSKPLLVLDIGCGKGGDLGKWQQAPQPIELYIGLDPADVSIHQARDRYQEMRRRGGRGRDHRRPQPPLFHAEFFPKDCYGEFIGDIPIIQQVGIDANVGPGGSGSQRWGGGGFDVVSMMFCMHYAFESETLARGMLRNVAGSLKKGGRFIGVIPNSDILSEHVETWTKKRKAKPGTKGESEKNKDDTDKKEDEQPEDGEVSDEEEKEEFPEWGNSIYKVHFHRDAPNDGVFRPPFGWKYSFFLEEAVEQIPEYVVPWEAFRAMAEDYNLELSYRKPFTDIWHENKDNPDLGPLSERMGVRERGRGRLLVSDEEMEAASFYHAFCFYKV